MDIFKTIGDAVGGFFSNSVVQLAIQAIMIYAVILWLAAAFWAFRDMQLRNENPVLPYLAAALIVLFTPVLFPFGVVVYRIVRPQERIGDVYERNLAEEALLAEVESVHSCPGCSRRVHDDWIICPSCRTRLNRVCANCGRLVGLDWSLCAWCGTDFERADIAAISPISGGLADPDRLEPTAASRAMFRVPSRAALLRTPQPKKPRQAQGTGQSGAFPER